MINQATLQGNWNEIRGKLRRRWGQLTNDDVETFNGNVEQLVGLIQRKTGEARSQVEDFLDELTAKGSASIDEATENVREYVQQAADRIQAGSQQAYDSFRDGYEQAEEMIRQRPTESVAFCFGIGVLVGLLIGASLRSR
ncbi:MAG TPA: CsbD family protein [Planctomycetaceae bacterium]|nr:CsbD family protein [Planctomycetaceae bacterium]